MGDIHYEIIVCHLKFLPFKYVVAPKNTFFVALFPAMEIYLGALTIFRCVIINYSLL